MFLNCRLIGRAGEKSPEIPGGRVSTFRKQKRRRRRGALPASQPEMRDGFPARADRVAPDQAFFLAASATSKSRIDRAIFRTSAGSVVTGLPVESAR